MVMNLNACREKSVVTSYANAGVENSTLDLKQCTIWKTTLETGSFWFTFPNQKDLNSYFTTVFVSVYLVVR